MNWCTQFNLVYYKIKKAKNENVYTKIPQIPTNVTVTLSNRVCSHYLNTDLSNSEWIPIFSIVNRYFGYFGGQGDFPTFARSVSGSFCHLRCYCHLPHRSLTLTLPLACHHMMRRGHFCPWVSLNVRSI